MTERCGCDESIALRRELEAGTVAMYRARARDAERARDELAREVALLGRQLADLTAATDAEAARLQSELLETMRDRDEARAQLAALRMAADRIATIAVIPYSDKGNAASAAYNDATRDTAAAAEAYTRRVRAEALREAAACLREHAEAMASGDRRAGVFTAVGMIGARADEIEEGR